MTRAPLQVVILAGGSGTRFWPAGRVDRPKQLLPLAHGRSLLGATIDRVAPLCGLDSIWIATSAALGPTIAAAVPEIPSERILLEPEARDTAPCAALAAACIDAAVPGAPIAMLPADHLIAPAETFRDLLRRGERLARRGHSLVTFGIRPTFAATGFGYIEPGEAIDDETPLARRVVRFREKPDRTTAETFLRDGRMLWNSGMFVWTADALQRAMRVTSPELADVAAGLAEAARAQDQERLAATFARAPKTSVDFAVMERAPDVTVVDCALDWNDIGSFAALGAVAPTDESGNVRALFEGARAVTLDARDCVVYGEGKRTIALLGVNDLIVVSMGDAVLVCARDRAEDIKRLQAELRRLGYGDVL